MVKIEKVKLTTDNLLKIKKIDDSFYKKDILISAVINFQYLGE